MSTNGSELSQSPNEAMAQLVSQVNRKLSEVLQRFERMEERLSQRIDKVASRISDLEADYSQLARQMERVQAEIGKLEDSMYEKEGNGLVFAGARILGTGIVECTTDLIPKQLFVRPR